MDEGQLGGVTRHRLRSLPAAAGATCALKYHHRSASPSPRSQRGAGPGGRSACAPAAQQVAGFRYQLGPSWRKDLRAERSGMRHASHSMHARGLLLAICASSRPSVHGHGMHLTRISLASAGGGKQGWEKEVQHSEPYRLTNNRWSAAVRPRVAAQQNTRQVSVEASVFSSAPPSHPPWHSAKHARQGME